MRSRVFFPYALALLLLLVLSSCREAPEMDQDVLAAGDPGVDVLLRSEDAGVDASQGQVAWPLVEGQGLRALPGWADAGAREAWSVGLADGAPSWDALEVGDRVQVDVGGAQWSATVLLRDRNVLGVDQLALRLDDGGLAFLVRAAGHLHGTVEPAGDTPRWWIRTDAEGRMMALAMPWDALQPLACGGAIPVPEGRMPPGRAPSDQPEGTLRPKAVYGGWQTTREGVVPVDMLMVYTPAAKAWGADNDSPMAFIASESVLRTNTAMALSEIEMRLDLVGLEEVEYTEAGDSIRDLYRITENEGFNPGGNAGDVGFMREVHTWRDALAADLVMLFTRTEDTGGLAWTPGTPNPNNEVYGFSMVRVQQASWTYTVAHEMAHNMGAAHSRLQSEAAAGEDGGMEPWATGWRWNGSNGRRTSVMTYEGQWQGNNWLPTAHFSNPNVLEGGEPTGVAEAGDGGPADNARQLTDARGWIADYRIAHYVSVDATGPGTVGIDDGTRLVDGESLEVALTPNSPDVQVVNLQVNGVPRTPTTNLVIPSVNDDLRIEVVFEEVIRQEPVILFSNTEQVYDGTTRRVTVTTEPADLPVVVRYEGSTTAPSQAGTYAVQAVVDTAEYFGEASTTLVIAPRAATISFTATDVLFNDRVQRPAVTTQPSGLSVTWETLEPAGAETSDAGDYRLLARINDPNHSGEAEVDFRIRPAPVIFSASGLQQVYDGTPRLPTISSTPSGVTPAIDWEDGSPPVNVGSWPFTVRSESGNWTGTLNRTLTITPRPATVTLGGLQKTWDGQPLAIQVTTDPPDLAVEVTFDGNVQVPSDAGTWTVRAEVVDPNHVGETTGTATITPAPVAIELSALEQAWTGQPRSVGVTTDPPGVDVRVTYNGNETPPTSAGSYTVVAEPRSSNQSGRAEGTLVVQPVAVTITPLSTSKTWDGQPVNVVQYTVQPVGIATAFSWVDGAAPSDAGTHPFRIDITDGNGIGGFEGVYTIRRLAATVALSDLERTWDGVAVPVTATTDPAGLEVRITYDGSEDVPAGAGTFDVRAEITDRNRSGEATGTFVVERGTATLSLEATEQVWSGEPLEVEVNGVPEGEDVIITYDEQPSPPTDVGTYAVRAVVESANWFGEVTGELVIAPQPVTFDATGLEQTYNRQPRQVQVTAEPENAPFEVLYDGEADVPVNAGTYTVTARATSPQQAGTAEWELVVLPADVVIFFDLLEQVADGLPRLVATRTEPEGVDLDITYDGDSAPPTNPGTYTVQATASDPNYAGEADTTLEVRCPANACETPGPIGCNGASPEVCEAQSWGCNLPRILPACAGGRVCEEGSCVVPCEDVCSLGEQQCSGLRPEVCELQETGCTAWVRQAACGVGEVCEAGTCVEACGDGCDEGSRRCGEDGVPQLCAFDEEGCLRYIAQRECLASAVCDAGRCVARPPTDSPTEPGTPPDLDVPPPSGGGSGGGCSVAPARTPHAGWPLFLLVGLFLAHRRSRRVLA